eukprot:6251915-Lingulodinium_polyedra.AAC.1
MPDVQKAAELMPTLERLLPPPRQQGAVLPSSGVAAAEVVAMALEVVAVLGGPAAARGLAK